MPLQCPARPDPPPAGACPRPRTRGGWLALVLTAGCYTGLPAEGRSPFGDVGEGTAVSGESTDSESGSIEPGSSSGAAGASTDTGEDPDTTGSGSTSGGAIEDPGGPWAAAVDIVPSGLHVNQGVGITLADGGVVIPGGSRSAKVIHGRKTLFIATWTTAPTFVPRPIRGELHLDHPDGTSETLVSETDVVGPSGVGDVDPHFSWVAGPAQLPPGTRWSVTLHELELLEPGDPVAVPPRLPVDGNSEFDDEDGNQRVRIVLIPYRHQYNGCDRLAPSDVGVIDGHRLAMEMQYPAQQVEITVHGEVAFGQSMATGDAVLANVVELRAAEAPAPDVYYYGLLWPCDESTNYGGLGYVPFEPTSVAEAPYRAAVGIWYDFAPAFTYQTMVHEVGHNHGRDHVACAGNEGATDPNYPIPGGSIGVFGWGIHDETFRPPTFADYMSYCPDGWSSTYAWNRTLPVIDALTVAVGGAPPAIPADAQGRGAVVLAVRDGEVVAATRIGDHAPRRSDGVAHWTLRDGTPAWTTMQRDRVPDSGAAWFTVSLPTAELDDIEHAEFDVDGARVSLARGALTRHESGRLPTP